MKPATGKPATKGLVRYLMSCTGVSPMLQNPMTDDTLDELIYGSAGKRKPPKTDVSIENIAEKRLCLGPNGEFGIPANYLFAALVDAGRHVIFDKKTKISTAKTSLVPNLLTIIPELVNEVGDGFIPFKDQKAKWIADKRRGVLAANGAAVAIVRPKFPTWAFDVTIEVNLDEVAIEKIQELFKKAGQYSGLGDFRPSKRGPFGRFSVTDLVELEQQVGEKQAA
jgi:hypothetical protein